jgi:hypothetical protein
MDERRDRDLQASSPEGCVIAAIVGGEPFASEIPGAGGRGMPASGAAAEVRPARTADGKARGAARGRPSRSGDGKRLGFLKIVAGMLGLSASTTSSSATSCAGSDGWRDHRRSVVGMLVAAACGDRDPGARRSPRAAPRGRGSGRLHARRARPGRTSSTQSAAEPLASARAPPGTRPPLEPDKREWRLETIYADHNLGTALIEQKRYREASARQAGPPEPVAQSLLSWRAGIPPQSSGG